MKRLDKESETEALEWLVYYFGKSSRADVAIRYFNHPNAGIRKTAVNAAPARREFFPCFERALEDDEWEVRNDAAFKLRDIDRSRAIETLRSLLARKEYQGLGQILERLDTTGR